MKRSKPLYGSGAGALTPSTDTPTLPTADAATIYRELLWWRDRARAAEKAYRAEQKRFTKFRAKGIARGIAKKLIPSRNPEGLQ